MSRQASSQHSLPAAAEATHSHRRQRGSNPGRGSDGAIAPRIFVGECGPPPIPLLLICFICVGWTCGDCLERFGRHAIRDQLALGGGGFEKEFQTTLIQGGTLRVIGATGKYEQ